MTRETRVINAVTDVASTSISPWKKELEQRTNAMGNEMMRWKQQADAAANAVSSAKDEVMERKRELDQTKEKMDILVGGLLRTTTRTQNEA